MGFFLIDTLNLQPENAPKHENQDTLRKKRVIQCLSAKRKVFMLLMYKCLKSSLRTFQLILMNYSAAHYFLQKFLIWKYAQHIANESTTSSSSKIVRTRATYVNYQPFLQSTYCTFLLYHCSIKRSTPGLLVVNIKTNMVCKELHSTRGGQIIQISCSSSNLCIFNNVNNCFNVWSESNLSIVWAYL